MNILNKKNFDMLVLAAKTFQTEIGDILERYRMECDAARETAKQFKEEDAYFKSKQTHFAEISREGISKSERVFCNRIDEVCKDLEGELQKHLAEPIRADFRERLSFIKEFGILPEPIELQSLLKQNAGNQDGLAALQNVLEKNGSPYRLTYHTTKDFQNDVEVIRGVCRNLKVIPTEFIHEGVEIYQGMTFPRTLPNGRQLGGSITYDSVGLVINASAFQAWLEQVEGMKEKWVADCSYDLADDVSKSVQAIDPETLPEPQSETSIIDDGPIEEALQIAREYGRQTAIRNTPSKELLSESGLVL